MFPDSPEIKKSFNYDIFKKIEWNRTIDKVNLHKLVKENREKFQLHKFPILVTTDMKVIDGQHRLEVAKIIGSPVYYIVDGQDDSFKAVHSVNKAGKKHSLKDKVEMLKRAGDHGAECVYKIYNLYGGKFDVSTIAAIIVSTTGGGQVTEAIDARGAIPLTNYDAALEVLDSLHYSSIPGKHKNRLVFSLMILSSRAGVHPKAIVSRIMQNLIKWIEPKSQQEAMRVMASCYNYGLTPKNRISTEKRNG